MLRDIRKNKIFNRRTFLVSGAQSALTFALVTRLSYLQLWKHGEYSVQSDSNSIKPIINPAPRGIVFDRKGIAMAVNENNYRLLLYLENKKNTDDLMVKLTEILNLDEDAQRIFRGMTLRALKLILIAYQEFQLKVAFSVAIHFLTKPRISWVTSRFHLKKKLTKTSQIYSCIQIFALEKPA